jgi:hypothetical protein
MKFSQLVGFGCTIQLLVKQNDYTNTKPLVKVGLVEDMKHADLVVNARNHNHLLVTGGMRIIAWFLFHWFLMKLSSIWFFRLKLLEFTRS